MKCFKFLKNINRGIVLLLIIGIGFAVYVTYDYVLFADRSEIEALVKEYTQKTAAMTLLPEEERNYQNVSESAVQKKLAENQQILDQYWTPVQTITYYPHKKSEENVLEYALEKAIESDPEQNGIVLDAEFVIGQVKDIRKTSPKTAEATVTYHITYRFQGNPSLYPIDMYWSNDPWSDEPQVKDDKVRVYKDTVNVTYGLLETQDGWKLSWRTNNYGSAGSSLRVEGEEENHGSSSAD